MTLPTTGLYTMTAGAAYQTNGSFQGSIHMFSSATLGGSAGIRLQHVGDGRLQVLVGTGPALAVTPISTFIMHQGAFYFVEMAVEVGNVPSDQIAATVWVNGEQILTGFLTVTHYTDYQLSQYIVTGGGISSLWSDLYITGSETTGDAALAYGDTAVYVQRPASDTGTGTWVPSTAGSHYAMVDDTTPDDLATILSDGGVSTEDLHGLTAVNASPNSPTILGAQFLACTEKNAAGPATYVHVYNEAATDYLDPGGATYNPSAGSWLYSREIQENNIDGSGVWTPTTLNALSFGLRRTV